MTATPVTTKLGPDQAQLRALMRRLAEAESTEAPILSIYADIRPQSHGERPAARAELITVRHRLDAIEATLEAHTPARESFDADRARLEGLIEGGDLQDSEGIAVFACDR